ncbi:MAG: DUF1634 domain-containing protein [Pseudobdellovibrio sp.]
MIEKSSSHDEKLRSLELRISLILRAGVVISGTFLLIGWLWMWGSQGDHLKSFVTYHPDSFFTSFQRAFFEQNYSLILTYIGLIVLVLLPLIRVLMTGILFIQQKDRALGAMAFFVFIILVASFLLGIDI